MVAGTLRLPIYRVGLPTWSLLGNRHSSLHSHENGGHSIFDRPYGSKAKVKTPHVATFDLQAAFFEISARNIILKLERVKGLGKNIAAPAARLSPCIPGL
jgi:hypothetical protein